MNDASAAPVPSEIGLTDTQVRERCAAVAARARSARAALAALPGGRRDALLRAIAEGIERCSDTIIAANREDRDENAGLSGALADRLLLDEARVASMADAVRRVASQPPVLGEVVEGRVLPDGVRLEKRRVPLGVVLVIYESRPNVTSDAAALCIKSGNPVVLKGGREALRSNVAIADAITEAARACEGDTVAEAVALVDIVDRRAVVELVRMEGSIDLAIPRGGTGLIRAVVEAARVPVVKHDAGLCHVYVDGEIAGMEDAAVEIVLNAKMHRTGVCNACETLLVHEAVAARLLPRIGQALLSSGCAVRGDERTRRLVPGAAEATEADWRTEYLSPVISVRVVGSLDEAVDHIERYGSQHTDAIVTASHVNAHRFTSSVTSASVMVNCSTRFADGGVYGLGAEIGISTDKLHARGPMGARDLTTFQWVLTGTGQIRR